MMTAVIETRADSGSKIFWPLTLDGRVYEKIGSLSSVPKLVFEYRLLQKREVEDLTILMPSA